MRYEQVNSFFSFNSFINYSAKEKCFRRWDCAFEKAAGKASMRMGFAGSDEPFFCRAFSRKGKKRIESKVIVRDVVGGKKFMISRKNLILKRTNEKDPFSIKGRRVTDRFITCVTSSCPFRSCYTAFWRVLNLCLGGGWEIKWMEKPNLCLGLVSMGVGEGVKAEYRNLWAFFDLIFTRLGSF